MSSYHFLLLGVVFSVANNKILLVAMHMVFENGFWSPSKKS
jgi:hypothetical protein